MLATSVRTFTRRCLFKEIHSLVKVPGVHSLSAFRPQRRTYLYVQIPPSGLGDSGTSPELEEINDDDGSEEFTDFDPAEMKSKSLLDDEIENELPREDLNRCDMIIPGGKEIRDYLAHVADEENDRHILPSDWEREIDFAADNHACEEFFGIRMEHEKPKDKRRRLQNKREGVRSSAMVYALVDYINLKKQFQVKDSEEVRYGQMESYGEGEETSKSA
mmetsp:Transcript_15362/g.23126  ORF Transcript_15362/g.23126 Transcript_15362/m.23126 type:complete len:218 (-) Transcript_15362:90-743(-)|eukprot:CAMPEP_0185023864 /NCGR_PEP_ID=MMETSP1103-20130426/6480_1 /TAXON_ID=36769 /ORGANISM="Paraphysomonas bandaiensis, Strain Caron Lab Isolate" /LENGTH=217 /DNA_ID=CAMNT_0027556639 /DNA_START=66 /DNA_END=719 /DNA_ORIENTATION=+